MRLNHIAILVAPTTITPFYVTPLTGTIIGVVTALCLVSLVILVVRLRICRTKETRKNYDDNSSESFNQCTFNGENKNEANGSIESFDEKNPDVIPQDNVEGGYRDDRVHIQILNNVSSYSRGQKRVGFNDEFQFTPENIQVGTL